MRLQILLALESLAGRCSDNSAVFIAQTLLTQKRRQMICASCTCPLVAQMPSGAWRSPDGSASSPAPATRPPGCGTPAQRGIFQLHGHTDAVRSVVLTPDGTTIVTGSGRQHARARVERRHGRAAPAQGLTRDVLGGGGNAQTQVSSRLPARRDKADGRGMPLAKRSCSLPPVTCDAVQEAWR